MSRLQSVTRQVLSYPFFFLGIVLFLVASLFFVIAGIIVKKDVLGELFGPLYLDDKKTN